MEIDIRCENCGEYLEIEKEWTDRNGINITVNPCDEKEVAQSLADKRLELLKAAKSWLESYLEYLDSDSPLGDEPNNSLAKLIDELAEAIAEE